MTRPARSDAIRRTAAWLLAEERRTVANLASRWLDLDAASRWLLAEARHTTAAGWRTARSVIDLEATAQWLLAEARWQARQCIISGRALEAHGSFWKAQAIDAAARRDEDRGNVIAIAQWLLVEARWQARQYTYAAIACWLTAERDARLAHMVDRVITALDHVIDEVASIAQWAPPC